MDNQNQDQSQQQVSVSEFAGNAIQAAQSHTTGMHAIIGDLVNALKNAEKMFVSAKKEVSEWIGKHTVVSEALEVAKKELENYLAKNTELEAALDQAKKDIEDLKAQVEPFLPKQA